MMLQVILMATSVLRSVVALAEGATSIELDTRGLEATGKIDVNAVGGNPTGLRFPPAPPTPVGPFARDGGEFDTAAGPAGLVLADHGRDLLHGCHYKRLRSYCIVCMSPSCCALSPGRS